MTGALRRSGLPAGFCSAALICSARRLYRKLLGTNMAFFYARMMNEPSRRRWLPFLRVPYLFYACKALLYWNMILRIMEDREGYEGLGAAGWTKFVLPNSAVDAENLNFPFLKNPCYEKYFRLLLTNWFWINDLIIILYFSTRKNSQVNIFTNIFIWLLSLSNPQFFMCFLVPWVEYKSDVGIQSDEKFCISNN